MTDLREVITDEMVTAYMMAPGDQDMVCQDFGMQERADIKAKLAASVGERLTVLQECLACDDESVRRAWKRVADLKGELRRCSDHLRCYADAYPEDRTADIDAALYCANELLGPSQ